MLNSLRIARDAAALEAFTSADMASFLRSIIPTMKAGFNDISAKFAPDAQPIQLTGDQHAFMKEINKHTYTDLTPLAAFVPEGLDTTYLNYAENLETAVAHASSIIDKILSPYSLFLSQLITNKEQKFTTASMDVLFKQMAKVRETANEELGACFKKGSHRSEVKYGDIIDRNSDWPKVFQNVDHQVKQINMVDRKVLAKKIKECGDLLEIIVTQVRRGDFEGVSSQVVTNLADGAYQAAAELEFFSVTYYKVLALSESVNRTMRHVQEVFKQ